MINRVATFTRNERMLAATLQTQARMAALQLQEASGLKSTDLGGFGAGAKRVVDLQVSVTRANAYIDSAQVAKGRVELTYSAAGTMADLLTEMRGKITAATSVDGGTGADLKAAAQDLLKDFAAVMNTQYEGRYLFAGGRTDTAPVDLDVLTPPTSPSTPDTSYYQGDGQIASVRVGDQQVVSYGVTGNDPAFEQALRAIGLIANIGTDPLDQATLDEGNALVVDALDAVLAVQSRLSLDAGALENAIGHQEDYVAFAESLASDLTEVDVAQLTAELSTYEAQLQASYAAFAKIQSLSLLDYLR